MTGVSRETLAYRGVWIGLGVALFVACGFGGFAFVSTYSHPLAAPPSVRQATANLVKPAPIVIDVGTNK